MIESPDAGTDDRFYVVQTQPQRERLAVKELSNQGFRTFLPCLKHPPRVWKGKFLEPRLEPLFPKYLFVQLSLTEEPWRSINGTRGVIRVMCMDSERPSPVPQEAMLRLLAAGEMIDVQSAGLPFNPGDTVEFQSGSFRGRHALVSLCAKDRVTLLLDLLGGQVTVHCEPAILRYVPRG